jgi:hypothetical protein
MRYLRVLLLVVMVLFIGSVACHAQGAGFHATVLDPDCPINTSVCALNPVDLGVTFPVSFEEANCTAQGIAGPADVPFGCFIGTNNTGEAITSFSLDFTSSALLGATCDTTTPGVTLPEGTSPAFSISGCTPDGSGGFNVGFSGGDIPYTHQFVILEIGVDPMDLGSSATADPTPEPDSLLLLSTGVMMSGLYFARRQRLFAFFKK